MLLLGGASREQAPSYRPGGGAPFGGRRGSRKVGSGDGKGLYIYPIGSMYGIYANIGGILMINVTIVRFKQSHLFKNPPSL